MEVLLGWIILSFAVAYLASRLGLGPGISFLFALFLSPIIFGLFLLIARYARKCPECQEGVDMHANKCKHCGYVLAPDKQPKNA